MVGVFHVITSEENYNDRTGFAKKSKPGGLTRIPP